MGQKWRLEKSELVTKERRSDMWADYIKSADEIKKIGPNVHIFGIAPMRTALRARFFPGENKEKLMSPKAEANRVLATLFDP